MTDEYKRAARRILRVLREGVLAGGLISVIIYAINTVVIDLQTWTPSTLTHTLMVLALTSLLSGFTKYLRDLEGARKTREAE